MIRFIKYNMIIKLSILLSMVLSLGIFPSHSYASNNNWMETLSDQNTLSRISIPGTHDSGTFRLADPIKRVWGQTQYLDFSQQLAKGIRLFDIRGRATSNHQIVLHHGDLYLYVTLHQFLTAATNFLRDNPSETIIMSFKEDKEKMEGVTKDIRDIFKDTYYPHYPFYRGNSSNPTLKETRGKIVLFDRTKGMYLPGYNGISWPDNTTFSNYINRYRLNLNVQDKYNVSYSEKEQAIKSFFKQTEANWKDSDKLFINYLSLSSGGTIWSSPYYYSSYLNGIAKNNINLRAGWVFMDYAGENDGPALIDKIISTNHSLP